MITVANQVGRFIEVRIASPVEVSEVAMLQQRLVGIFAASSQRFVVAVDLRSSRVFPPEISAAFLAVMRNDNPRFERAGYFISDSATFALQIERMIKEADSPTRKTHRTAAGMFEWLAPLLGPDEQARLRAFLAEDPG